VKIVQKSLVRFDDKSGTDAVFGIESRNMRRRFPRGLALWISVSSALAGQVHAQRPSPAAAAIAYPNNSEGLRKLLNNMLLAARRADESELQSMIRETEIPNYQSWFTTNFGQEKGESWAEPYGQWLAKDEREFQELMRKLAHLDGEFAVEQLDAAKRYDLLDGPLDEYRASWKRPEAPKGEELVSVADFFFVEGKFRWYTGFWSVPFQKRQTGSVVTAKLVKKVEPEYPAEAQEKKIQGSVKLRVVVQKNGSVAVQRAVEGDPIFYAAAIEAVRQ
jgi:hypothetical protein